MIKHRRDGDRAEREPYQQRHQRPGLLDERQERLTAPPRGVAERQTAGKRGDEAVAVQGYRRGVRAHRQAQHRRTGETLGHPVAAPGQPDQPAARAAHHGADGQAEGQLRHGLARADPGFMRGSPRSRHRDQHERRGDPVVEPALHVDQAADPGRDRAIDHHAGAQRSVRRGQGGTDQQGQPDVDAPEQGQRQQRAQADRERQPDPQQPHAQAQLRAQVPQPDPGRIGKQHQHQRDLGQDLHRLLSRRDPQHRQRAVRQHQPGNNEYDWRRHVEPLQPRRYRTPREYQRRHERQVRSAHRLTGTSAGGGQHRSPRGSPICRSSHRAALSQRRSGPGTRKSPLTDDQPPFTEGDNGVLLANRGRIVVRTPAPGPDRPRPVSRAIYRVSAPDRLPAGRHQLRFEFEPTGKPDFAQGKGAPGLAQLYVDGQLIANTEFPVTTPIAFNPGGVTCGANPGSAIVGDYQAPFPFTGLPAPCALSRSTCPATSSPTPRARCAWPWPASRGREARLPGRPCGRRNLWPR